MSMFFDHIISIIIGMTVLAIVTLVQIRSSQHGIEQVSAHAAKVKALSFGEWIEDDIVSLGANMGQNRARFSVPDTLADGNTGYWEFYSDSLQSGGTVMRVMTRYRLILVDTLLVDDEPVSLYQARRETVKTPVVGGTPQPVTEADWLEDGRSVATLSFFKVGLLLGNGEETLDAEKADFIRVRFAMVPEFELRNSYLRELYWTTTLKVRPFWQPIEIETS